MNGPPQKTDLTALRKRLTECFGYQLHLALEDVYSDLARVNPHTSRAAHVALGALGVTVFVCDQMNKTGKLSFNRI
eukprot:gene17909-21323_t